MRGPGSCLLLLLLLLDARLSHSDVTLRPVALHPTHIQGAWSFSFPWLCSSNCSALSQSAGWTP